MIRYDHQVMEDQTLTLDQPKVYTCLGPELVLRRCTVELRKPARSLILSGATLEDCLIRAVRRQYERGWGRVWLRRCYFQGRFSSCDFGHWPDEDPAIGGIEDCDLSAATLDGCRFIDCDASRLRFPPWPCFTVLAPFQRQAELAALPWPAQTSIIPRAWEGWGPPETAAITYWAPEVIRRNGSSLEELSDFLATLNGVIM